ncbi:MAG TPA: hypothetical protein VJ757_00505 [Pseudonocardiaceae bacterium]|nr:hypothetical protein [Pseudonocardiaceae bacterium]
MIEITRENIRPGTVLSIGEQCGLTVEKLVSAVGSWERGYFIVRSGNGYTFAAHISMVSFISLAGAR